MVESQEKQQKQHEAEAKHYEWAAPAATVGGVVCVLVLPRRHNRKAEDFAGFGEVSLCPLVDVDRCRQDGMMTAKVCLIYILALASDRSSPEGGPLSTAPVESTKSRLAPTIDEAFPNDRTTE